MDRIAVIDTETGGLDEFRHSLISVSITKISDRWETLGSHTWYIKQPEYIVTSKAMQINKIDLGQAESWTTPDLFMTQLIEFLEMPASILSGTSNDRNRWRIRGKNPDFDKKFLQQFMRGFGSHVFDSLFYHWTECVLQNWYNPLQRLGVVPLPAKRDLTNLCKLMKIEVDESKTHTADYDVELTIALGRKLTLIEDKVRGLIKRSKAAK